MTDKLFHQGTVIGDWKLSRFVGGGGQGEVWEVRPTTTRRTPSRIMKICAATEPTERSRFAQEAALLERLAHPNIVRIVAKDCRWHEVRPRKGAEPLQVSYLVTERYQTSISNLGWIHSAPLLALQVFRATCEAARFLHAQSPPIIHRDIKPDNILFEGEDARTAVCDFGIARILEGGVAPLTQLHEIVGTPGFRAPEVTVGERGDQRSDIYSLGRTLEWLLTGALPQTPIAEVPGTSSMSQSARDALREVVSRACAYDPATRFSSVEELIASLPELVLEVRSRNHRAAAKRSPQPGAAYSEASELLASGNSMGWRSRKKSRLKQLRVALDEWRVVQDQTPPEEESSLEEMIDAALGAVAPALAEEIAAVENPEAGLADVSSLLQALAAPRGWNWGDTTVIAQAPRTVAYVAQNVLGAIAIEAQVPIITLQIANTPIVAPSGVDSTRLINNTDLTGWPVSLGKRAATGWKYLRSLSKKHSWLIDAFGTPENYQECLTAHFWRMSFIEFCDTVPRLDRALTERWVPNVPPVWMHGSASEQLNAYSRAFPNHRTVDSLSAGLRPFADLIARRWPDWIAHLREVASPNGPFLPRYTLPPLPV